MKVTTVYASTIPGMTIGQSIAHIARVSNPHNQMNHATAPKLLQYLVRHKHWSPFEMMDICFDIETTLAIAAQIERHRSFSFQRYSNRYSNAMAIEKPEFRKQGKTNRQSSEEVMELDSELQSRINWHLDQADELYQELLEQGVSRETARNILPECTSTRLYMKGSVRSWIHYIWVRRTPETQKEHREIAALIAKYILDAMPELTNVINQKQLASWKRYYPQLINTDLTDGCLALVVEADTDYIKEATYHGDGYWRVGNEIISVEKYILLEE